MEFRSRAVIALHIEGSEYATPDDLAEAVCAALEGHSFKVDKPSSRHYVIDSAELMSISVHYNS